MFDTIELWRDWRKAMPQVYDAMLIIEAKKDGGSTGSGVESEHHKKEEAK